MKSYVMSITLYECIKGVGVCWMKRDDSRRGGEVVISTRSSWFDSPVVATMCAMLCRCRAKKWPFFLILAFERDAMPHDDIKRVAQGDDWGSGQKQGFLICILYHIWFLWPDWSSVGPISVTFHLLCSYVRNTYSCRCKCLLMYCQL